jgi:hypothetical protein
VLFDPDGRTAEAFQLMGMPTTGLIDRTGAESFLQLQGVRYWLQH